MAMGNQTSAYDLSAFKKKKETSANSELKVINGRKGEKAAQTVSFSTLFFGALLIALIAATLYGNAVINELGNQISEATDEYNMLVGENKKLTAILESKVSLKNVEAIAKDRLGLAKMEPYQIEYVNLLPEDKIEYIKNTKDEKITDRILQSVNGFIAKDDAEDKSNESDKSENEEVSEAVEEASAEEALPEND